MWGLVTDEVAVGQVYLVTLCYPLSFIIPLMHHVYSSSSAAGIIGQLITEILRDSVKLTPEMNNNKFQGIWPYKMCRLFLATSSFSRDKINMHPLQIICEAYSDSLI